MKRFVMFLLSVAVSAAIIMSCEGPAGPKGDTGATGANGKDGKDASLSCTACHGNDDVDFIMAQYDLSKHNKGIVYEEEAGRINCGGCHSGDGFAESVTLGKDDPVTKATSKINCQACHPIHEKFTTEDFALRVQGPIKLRHTGAEFDFKKGNTCARCHQARTYAEVTADTYTPSKASATATYSRFGPHYGTPANVFAMKGLYEIQGSQPIEKNNPHANLANACVTCHMGSNPTNPAVGGHSFLMTAAQMLKDSTGFHITGCDGCHSNAKVKAATIQKDVAAKIAEMRRLLIDKGMIDTSQAITAEGYQPLGEYFVGGKQYTKIQAQIVLNYMYIMKDRSLGVHNPGYVKAVLTNSLEELKK